MSDATPPPAFAVVGHPNKGKSSIVATLAGDDTVAIRPEPGTTTRAAHYPMRVDDLVLYVLIDTPGFERPKAALDWMRKHETTAAQHPQVVRQFVEAHRADPRFAHEVELLTPLLEGAGILYVVDGSVPYGPEYEPEMEVLRWTGRPSMALINPIGRADHVEQWRDALGQYFRIVRVFNAVTADFDKRLELLRAFGQLREEWRLPLQRATTALVTDREQKLRASARIIADMLVDALRHIEYRAGLPHDAAEQPVRDDLLERFKAALRKNEEQSRRAVEEVYGFTELRRRETNADAELGELFSKRSFVLFGLTRGQLVWLGAGGGVMAGLGFDVAVAGVSHGAGAVLGGAFGAAGAALGWFGGGKLAEVSVTRHLGGGKEVRCGPVRDANVPFVLLGRARHHHALIAGRTHARRDDLVLDPSSEGGGSEGPLTPVRETERRELGRVFARLRKAWRNADVAAETRDALTRIVEDLIRGESSQSAL